jgi:hypothetical protein
MELMRPQMVLKDLSTLFTSISTTRLKLWGFQKDQIRRTCMETNIFEEGQLLFTLLIASIDWMSIQKPGGFSSFNTGGFFILEIL